MEIFKKISDLLTPPPVPKPGNPSFVSPAEPVQDLGASVRPLLRKLCSADSLSDPPVKDCLAELKQIAVRRGLYQTAFEVKNQLDMLPRANEENRSYHKTRGYVLAADFFLGHIRQEIEALKSQSRAVGPNVFRGYCDEMVGCLLQGENARRAVEIPVLVIEELLTAAIDFPERAESFLELAVRAVTSATELIRDTLTLKPGRTSGRFASDSGITDTAQRRQRGGEGLDDNAARYLADLQAKTIEIQKTFGQCRSGAPGSFYLALLKATEQLGCAPFSATLGERIGLQQELSKSGEAARYFERAGQLFEAQGDLEHSRLFSKLAGLRYRKAHELYQRANTAHHVTRVHAKLAEMTAPKPV